MVIQYSWGKKNNLNSEESSENPQKEHPTKWQVAFSLLRPPLSGSLTGRESQKSVPEGWRLGSQRKATNRSLAKLGEGLWLESPGTGHPHELWTWDSCEHGLHVSRSQHIFAKHPFWSVCCTWGNRAREMWWTFVFCGWNLFPRLEMVAKWRALKSKTKNEETKHQDTSCHVWNRVIF